MPYHSLNELPDAVKDNLPHHAQEIFKEAFNSASDEYKEEERAFKVAWSAVKKKYKKDDNDKWVEK
ncbi:cation transporter [Peribacillus cavernae]|uniref:Cation transporter n=1 Tax=Peribacillus cavernae TaxID=1674310 RepID=A0A3S0TRG6_9BACI|nr:ChaB family protein [Peribacillus cavernae]MDQ0220356.1 cation transport regulator [Peribacillus cavernae]RUQ25552.1 cation transporter [Peribacillus cavernae]